MEKVKYKQYVHSITRYWYSSLYLIFAVSCLDSPNVQGGKYATNWLSLVFCFPVICCCVSLVQYVQTRVTPSVNFLHNSLISLSVRN
jgi:hypothetical protein